MSFSQFYTLFKEMVCDSIVHIALNLNAAGDHIGDIETFDVYKKQHKRIITYSVFLDAKLVIVLRVLRYNNEIKRCYLAPEFKNNGILSALFVFLHFHENFTNLIFTNIVNNDIIFAANRVKSVFVPIWSNIAQEFNLNVNDFSRFVDKKSKWKLKLLPKDTQHKTERFNIFRHPKLIENRQYRIADTLYFEYFVD